MPVPKTYYHDRIITGILCVPLILAVTYALVLFIQGEIKGLGAILASIPGFILIVMRLSPSRTHLKLDEEGFIASSIFGKANEKWEDIAEFGVEGEGFRSRVGYSLRADVAADSLVQDGSKFAKTLPEKFNIQPEELAQIMNDMLKLYG